MIRGYMEQSNDFLLKLTPEFSDSTALLYIKHTILGFYYFRKVTYLVANPR